jgi:hypothetical protein
MVMEFLAGLIGFAIIIGVIVGLFLLFRVVVLWYWKLDKIEEHLLAIRIAIERGNSPESNND